MSEIREIQQRLEKGEKRFAEGERNFSEIGEILSDIKAHLSLQDAHLERQDEAIALVTEQLGKVAQGTQDVVTMWNGGVKAVRFFCRMAEAWRFLMRQVLYPFGFPIALIYGLWYFHQHGSLPEWAITAFKFFNGVL